MESICYHINTLQIYLYDKQIINALQEYLKFFE